MKEVLVAPSMLAADFSVLRQQVEMLNASKADYIHIDIMDGVFVPNISFGFPVTQAIHKYAKKPLDFHLMIKDPVPYLQACKESGAAIISVHYEEASHLHRTVTAIKNLGAKAGVVLNPHTSVSVLDDLLAELDLVLIMSVNPGFGGQKFIPHTLEKVAQLRAMAEKSNPNLIIEVDGGVTLDNARNLIDHGANMLVAGSFVFQSADPAHTINLLKNV